MKVVILAGGLPSTISKEDEKIPKPMAEIGGRPILWHIMKQYDYYGIKDFVICTGYKGELIKQYFMDYYIYQSDITVDLQSNEVRIHHKKTEDWNVSVIDTGIDTSMLERIRRIKEYVGQETFIVTYGDCVSDINVKRMIAHHSEKGKYATIAVAHPTGRNTILPIDGKGQLLINYNGNESEAWVNACSMIFESNIFEIMNEQQGTLEEGLFVTLAKKGEIVTYKHAGFWSPMETMRDRMILEQLWMNGQAPWKLWENN